mgnify:CR=1 FL=1
MDGLLFGSPRGRERSRLGLVSDLSEYKISMKWALGWWWSAAGVGGAGGPSGPAAFIQLDVADAVGIAPLLELMPPLSAQALGLDPWVRHAPTGPRLGDPG